MGLLDLKREQSRVQTQLVEIEGQISRSTRAIAEAQARVPELKTRTQRDTAEELAKLESELAEVRESMLRAQDRVERLTIRSPVRGTAKGLQTETIGGVVAPGSTVMEIIPSGVAMVVEARIQTKDIGFVKLQQPVDVKLAAYDYTRFGSAHGTVETLSATTFQDDKGTPFYRARIRLAENHLGDDPTRNTIIPGMTVMADIQTGQKTVLSYLLKPIVRATGEALRER
jgi:adhesin transport system membrane fusion protein